jgi:hypothetical protein
LLALAACRVSKSAETGAAVEIADVAAQPPVVVAKKPEAARVDAGPPDTPSSITFAGDGTIVVVGERTIVARAKDGTLARQPLAKSESAEAGDAVPGVVVRSEQDVRLLATPSLRVLASGKGETILFSPGFVVIGHEVLVQHGDALLRLAIPSDASRVVRVTPVASGTRINMSYAVDDDGGGHTEAKLFDAQTGAVVGRGVPLESFAGDPPRAATSENAGFFIEGSKLSRISLTSGKVEKQVTIRCGGGQQWLNNPTPSASGDTVLVTCNGNGIVLDGVTLVERRRIPDIIPGCDNGAILGGVIDRDNRTLLLGGCGGEAKLDLTTGKFKCGDDPGLLGAPYEIVGGGPQRTVPAGRENVPRCTNESEIGMVSFIGHGITLVHKERLVVRVGSKTIELEEGASYPKLSHDESLMAYPRGDRVMLRSLPDGEPRGEFGLGP